MKRSTLSAVVVLVAGLLLPVPSLASSPPILSWSPTTSAGTYDFGTVAPGLSNSTIFILTNIGGSSTGALTIELSGSAAFATAADTCKRASLSPSRSCSVTVRYTPVENNPSDSATLAVKGKKPNANASLSLAGTSVLPRQIYWSNTNLDTMGRANADGQGVNQNFMTGSFSPGSLDIDSDHLWWSNLQTVGRADLDGQNMNASFIMNSGDTLGVAVDATHVYWAHTDPNPAATGIGRADLNGLNPNLNFIVGTTDPIDVAVDAGHIYWADNGTNSIGRADIDGTNINATFITGASGPLGVTVDSGHVYWTNSGTNSIGRADLNGQNVNATFITGASFPFGVTVDSAYIYWTNASGGSIGRADLTGQNVNQGFITGADGPRGVAVEPN